MAFTDEQTKALAGKLHPDNVKKNPKGFDYIEAWHAIAEMNRIFGHDGWDREMIRCVQCGEPYQDAKNNWRVGYWATVRIRVHVGDTVVVRDGTGYGSGIVKDLNDAHESAVKEAESDAMKRALMTLGNPFGLALYDKAKEGVGRDDEPAKLPKSKLQQAVRDLVAKINKAEDEDQIELLTGDDDNAAVARQARQDAPDFWHSITVALAARRAHFEAQRQADSADVTHQPVASDDMPKDYFFLVDEVEACQSKEDLRRVMLDTTARRAGLPKAAQAKLREIVIERQNSIKQASLMPPPVTNGAGFTDLTAAG